MVRWRRSYRISYRRRRHLWMEALVECMDRLPRGSKLMHGVGAVGVLEPPPLALPLLEYASTTRLNREARSTQWLRLTWQRGARPRFGDAVASVNTTLAAPAGADAAADGNCTVRWRSWSFNAPRGHGHRLVAGGDVVWARDAACDSTGWVVVTDGRAAESLSTMGYAAGYVCYMDAEAMVPCPPGGVALEFQSDVKPGTDKRGRCCHQTPHHHTAS